MEQVRAILKILWRERFWVLSVVGILVAVVCWHLSSSALDVEFSSRKSAIDGRFSEMITLSDELNHPNDKVNEGNLQQTREQSKNVLAVWQELYDRQRKEVLFWPKESLKASFIAEIEKLKFGDEFPAQVARDMRTHYANYISSRFDGLLKIVKALKSDARGGGRFNSGGRGGPGEAESYEDRRSPVANTTDEPVEEDYLVEWSDQMNLREKLEFAGEPTAMEIWVTQEDLWVYETLLNVIANTNEKRGATRPDNTAVRVIENLEVGRDAAIASREKGFILIPITQEAGTEGGESEAAYSETDSEVAVPRESGEPGVALSNDALLAGRYLDPEGNPYAAGPEDKEYRRLPVRLRLTMDQRYVPQLLVECANAALPVEVKQVRVNPDASGARFGGSTGIGRRSRGGSREELNSDPNLADVEIRGVVFIYNKPDETMFEELAGDEGQLADAAAVE